MNRKPPPTKLYKYRAADTIALRLLTNAEAYYADPKCFNDPLDCCPTIDIDLDVKSLERLCFRLLKQRLSKEAARAKIYRHRYYATEDVGDAQDPRAQEALKYILAEDIRLLVAEEIGTKGVLSMAEQYDCPLMWSHYGDQHRGICIEYDTTGISHPDIGPVSYASPRSIKASDVAAWKHSASEMAKRTVFETYYFSKSPHWAYEKEWRDINATSGAEASRFAITGVYLGYRCDPSIKTVIVKLFQGRTDISLYEMYPENDSFRLLPRELERDEIEANGVRNSAFLDFSDVFEPVLDGEPG